MQALKIAGIIVLVLLISVAALLSYAWYRLNHVNDKGDLVASIDTQVEKFFAREQAVGMVVGVYKDGRSFTKGYGSLLRDQNIPPDGRSVMELASVSKLFTTSLLQILADRGIVRLDDRIADLLKDHVTMPPAAGKATLRHLATHTSGFPSLPESMMEKMVDAQNPYKDLRTQDLYDYLKHCAGKKEEGDFEYSNFGMGLLGHILALKAGADYETAVLQELIQPLEMSRTFVTIDSEAAASIAQGYDVSGAAAPVWTDTVLTGAGSFLSCAEDMLLFIRANLDKEHPMHPVLARTHAPQPERETGLGWILPAREEKFMGLPNILWHNGMAGGYAAYLAIDPVSGNGVVVLSNKAVDVTRPGAAIMRLVNSQSWKRAQPGS